MPASMHDNNLYSTQMVLLDSTAAAYNSAHNRLTQ
jgi:hypothetical protein